MCYSGVAASEGVHVLKVHASLIEIHIQVTNHHVMGHFFTLMNIFISVNKISIMQPNHHCNL